MDVISNDDLAALARPDHRLRTRPLMEVEFEALMYMLRDGASALSRSKVQTRLARTTEDQLQQAVGRLTRRSLSNAEPWKPEEIRSLVEITKARAKGQPGLLKFRDQQPVRKEIGQCPA